MPLPYIIVPVYNGAFSLKEFLGRLHQQWLDRLVIVDDGSSDETSVILKKLNYTTLTHEKNRGKGAAIQSGLHWINENGGTKLITIDIDLQHPPEMLDEFSAIPYETILLGYRNDRRKMPLLRQVSNFLTSLLISIRSGAIIKDSQCGYRSFHTKVFKDIRCYENGFQFESEFLIKAVLSGWKVQHIPIPTIYGNESSSMRHVRDTIKFIIMWLKSFFWI
ncbi:MAG TPA: glycosyltransferase family 2 protein [Candidatus Marinimicrobia bacterium]|jgi:glycosyltransferase involved in cell wall biosynthesis|nr:hypothetical protein [Candidatus Neomarinimicrobiota bacterium]HJL74211.1 glycosyltransferase family 2 protein [Candidatus Neomarinimicrobiota bacterium]HJM70111.1 glycosyltransferase family 2 protein [Candidatus Neomarinimicrobiota bacterium]|tara:strand:- start:1160 stop:1819 length:660 start_codon:yes stop_codon:yes gene_type:complete